MERLSESGMTVNEYADTCDMKNMSLDNLMKEYIQWRKENDLHDMISTACKIVEEYKEYNKVIKAASLEDIKESCDCVFVFFAYLDIITNGKPLIALYDKFNEVKERYAKQKSNS